jgi:type II secretory pathway pseudopilin PulG
MKPVLQSFPKRARAAGFTLVEFYIVSGIFLVLVGAMIALQIFGLQVYTLAATKLTATAGGRKALNEIRDAVRAAKDEDVGIYTNGSTTFNGIGNGTNQIGNALLIFTNISRTNGLLFFMDQASSSLLSVTMTGGAYSTNGYLYTGTPGGLVTNVPFVANYLVFDAEDYLGNVLTNNQNNRIVHMTLQFSQWEYPVAGVGSGSMYDYYQLHTKVTRRATD